MIKTGRRLRLTPIKSKSHSIPLCTTFWAVFFGLKTGAPLPASAIWCLKRRGVGVIQKVRSGAAIRDKHPGWLKKIPKPGQRSREGK